MTKMLLVLFVVALFACKANGQTPLCATFPSCSGISPCCQCTGGPTTCDVVMNVPVCQSSCAVDVSSDPSAAVLRWSFYPVSLSGVNTSHTYTMTVNAYIHGQAAPVSTVTTPTAQASTSYIDTLNSYFSAWSSYITGTPPVPPTPTTISWSPSGFDFPPMAYSHFSVYIADSTANTYQSYIFNFNLTSSPMVATGLATDLAGVQMDYMPLASFPVAGLTAAATTNNQNPVGDNDPPGIAKFAYTSAPIRCEWAGVEDGDSCTSFCKFMNSFAADATGTFSPISGPTFSCTCSSSTVFGNTGPVYSCNGDGESAVNTAASSTSSTSFTSSSVPVVQNNNGGNGDDTVTQSASVGGGSNAGAIAGGIIGGLACVVICVVGIVLYNRRKGRVVHSSSSFQMVDGATNA